jgi:Zn-finger nucleic acid-binding protein
VNCPNCGAPMAPLETHPCWQCGHCTTIVCPESAAPDGVRMLGASQDGRARDCPVCAQPMLAAVMDDRYRIEMCAQCKGTLMPRHTFAETVVGRRHAAATRATPVSPANRRELERRVACPSCGGPMLTDWYYGPGNIVIDSCPTCDLVWLDAGELQRVIDAPGGDRRP